MNLICLDIEATERGEMLELSVIRLSDHAEIYHSYYRPRRTRKWRTDIHHITPAMVKDAPRLSKERAAIQRIINEADGIVGFAVNNDLTYLKSNGISIPKEKKIIDVQKWYWLYKGRQQGMNLGTLPGLGKCAQVCGLNFSEECDAHSASNDTLATILVLEHILHDNSIPEITDEVIGQYRKAFDEAKAEHTKIAARGILSLHPVEGGYTLNCTPVGDGNVDADLYITVDSRHVANRDMRKRFAEREIAPESGIYALTDKDIEFFKNYTCTYVASLEKNTRHTSKKKKSKKQATPPPVPRTKPKRKKKRFFRANVKKSD